MLSIYSFATSLASAYLVDGIKCLIFVSLSTTTRIALYSLLLGISVTKSIDISVHGQSGIDIDQSTPSGAFRGTLLRVHILQFQTYYISKLRCFPWRRAPILMQSLRLECLVSPTPSEDSTPGRLREAPSGYLTYVRGALANAFLTRQCQALHLTLGEDLLMPSSAGIARLHFSRLESAR